jgi:uncharacterized membrane protein
VDSNTRSIAKAISYRLLGSLSTGAIVFIYSNDATVSVGIGLLDVVVKMALYYVHERVWNHVTFGRRRPPEYEI